MLNYVIGTYQFREKHTATNLKQHLVSMLSQWGLISSSENLSAIKPQEGSDTNSTFELDDVEEKEEDTSSDDDEDNPAYEPQYVTGNLPHDMSVYITTDNASNISKAVKESGHNHVRCFGHTINIAVQKGLLNMQTQLAKLRKIVKYFHHSNNGTIAQQVGSFMQIKFRNCKINCCLFTSRAIQH